MKRRSFLKGLGIGAIAAVFRPDKWVEKPLPIPEPEVGEFVKVTLPSCFYTNVSGAKLVSFRNNVTEKAYIDADCSLVML